MNSSFASVPFVYDGRDKIILPKMFTPSDDVVIIGRGKKVQQHPANRRFRALIESQLEAYSNAATKGLKSNILWRVLHEVRGYSPSRLGFVKRDNDSGRWYAIDDASAKINISQAFRDGLHSDYKSSKKRKQVKRKAEISDSPVEDGQLERNIFEALTHLEAGPDHSASASVKRVCVATNQKVSETTDGLDHSFGRIGSTMDRLRSFLENPPNIPQPVQVNQVDLIKQSEKKSESWDTFESLYKTFGASQTKLSDDPFEPKPILPSSSLQNETFMSLKRAASRMEFEFTFAPFSMANMVDETNPPEIVASSHDTKKASQQFDAFGYMQEPILPSILSLSSLELSDADTLNGMSSLSSLSTVADNSKQELQDVWDFERIGDSGHEGFLWTR